MLDSYLQQATLTDILIKSRQQPASARKEARVGNDLRVDVCRGSIFAELSNLSLPDCSLSRFNLGALEFAVLRPSVSITRLSDFPIRLSSPIGNGARGEERIFLAAFATLLIPLTNLARRYERTVQLFTSIGHVVAMAKTVSRVYINVADCPFLSFVFILSIV